MCCGDCNGYAGPMRLTSTNPVVVLNAPTNIRIRAVYNGFAFGGAPLAATVYAYESNIGSILPSMQGCCPPPVVVAPPATASVSICPTPACFTWGGAQYNSIAAFVSDVKDLVPGAGYNPVTCTFSAPAGTVFPDLTILVCAPVPPAYCPSLRLDVCGCSEVGFAFRAGDSTDPAATISIIGCTGAVEGLIYPTPGVGHTVPYTDGGTTVVGYLANQSACAPEVSAVTNVYTSVAAPVVNVAAPDVSITLPAPTLVATSVSPLGVVTNTLTDGTTVVSNEPAPGC
jgi:hypothetical protein